MRVANIAGLRTEIEGEEHGQGAPAIVLLHGFGMRAEDLRPFAGSLSLPARFLFPEGPVELRPGLAGRPFATRSYWSVDTERRTASMLAGARDLSGESPEGLPAARGLVGQFLTEAAEMLGAGPLVLGGFSQGAMLALDYTLHASSLPTALVQLSGAPLTIEEWRPRFGRLAGIPVFASHGEADPDLSFAAALALKDELAAKGALMTWVPFAGGHEIPFVVWRALRKFLGRSFPFLRGG